jgi:membrane-associated phospholipid phosphatase
VSSSPPTHRTVAIRVLLVVVMWVGLAAVLVGAGELVTHGQVIDRFDRHVTAWVVAHRSHALNTTMKAITWGGSWVAVATTGGLLLVLVAVRKLPLGVVILASLGWVGEVVAVNLVKTLVDRQRPPQILWLVTAHGGSFPSGHAANATLVFATAGFVWYLLANSSAVRIAGILVSVLAILAVGFSRVELGVHWTTDVVASFVVVTAWLVGIGLLLASHLHLPLRQTSPSGRAVERCHSNDAPVAVSE